MSQRKKKFQLPLQIVKVDEAQRLVYGVAAIEEVDKSKEILDYESSKPLFEKWSADFEKTTNGKSKGNVRYMHENDAVGKLTEFAPNDENKSFEICAKVVDDAAWEKVVEGVLTGFSIGGEYERRWDDPTHKGVKRYTAKPSEVSLVDNPCIPGALFEFIKTDGATELRKFAASALSETDVDRVANAVAKKLTKAEKKTKAVDGQEHPAADFAFVGDPEDIETWHLPIFDEAHVRDALARFNQTSDLGEKKASIAKKLVAKAKEYGIDTKKFEEEYVKLAAPNLKKNLYDVGRLACLLMDLSDIQCGLKFEAEWENDGSKIPQNLADQINNLSEVLIALVSEEAGELVAATTGTVATEKSFTEQANDMKKEIEAELTKLESSTDPEVQKVASHLKTIGKCVDKLCDDHEKMGKSLDVLDGKAEKGATHLKEIGEHVDKIRKCHDSMGKSLETLKGGDDETKDGDAEAKDGKKEDAEGKSDEKKDDAKEAEKVTPVEVQKSEPVAEVSPLEKKVDELTDIVNALAKMIQGAATESAPVQKTYSAAIINTAGIDALNSGQSVTVTKENDGGSDSVQKAATPQKINKNVGDMTDEEKTAFIKMINATHKAGGTPVSQMQG